MRRLKFILIKNNVKFYTGGVNEIHSLLFLHSLAGQASKCKVYYALHLLDELI